MICFKLAGFHVKHKGRKLQCAEIDVKVIYCSPNIYKEARKLTVPYCNTAPILPPLTPYGSSMLSLV